MPIDPNLDLPTRSVFLLLGMAMAVLLAISVAWAVAIERIWSGKPLVPAREGRPAPWGGREVLICFLTWQVVTLVASQLLNVRRGEGGELDLVAAMSAVSLVNLLLLVVLPAILLTLGKASPADLGFRRETIGGDLLVGVVGALVLVPIVYAVQFGVILIWKPTAHPMQEMLFEVRSVAVMVLAVASAVVLAPAAEELMFRGFLQGWLEKRLGPEKGEDGSEAPAEGGLNAAAGRRSGVASPVALVLPAFLFATVHFGQWPAPVPLFVLALGLGVVYRRTKGLVAPMAMHATFNGLSTMAMIVALLALPDSAFSPGTDDAVPVPPVPAAADPASEGGPESGGLQRSGGAVEPPSDQNVESV